MATRVIHVDDIDAGGQDRCVCDRGVPSAAVPAQPRPCIVRVRTGIRSLPAALAELGNLVLSSTTFVGYLNFVVDRSQPKSGSRAVDTAGCLEVGRVPCSAISCSPTL